MTKKVLVGLLLASAALLSGCASTAMLPATANDVAVGGTEGKVGWSSYREEAIFKNTAMPDAIAAAKAGLGDAGFALREVNVSAGKVVGEHGMTAHDWNIIAGVYLKPQGKDVVAIVLAEGSKDIGFSGDVTSGAWTGDILKGMRAYLRKETAR